MNGSTPGRGGVGLVACLVLAVLAQACARDAAQVRWDDGFASAAATERSGDLEAAGAAYVRLKAEAVRAIDVAEAQKAHASVLLGQGDDLAALRIYWDMGQTALRRPDRARGHYEIARYVERVGRIDDAIAHYRHLVLTYPDEMPGPRALGHLQRLAETRGIAGALEHLRWTHAQWPRLEGTRLADNLLSYPARITHDAYRRTEAPKFARHAEILYRRLVEEHPDKQLVNDTYWALSLLYHRQGRYADELNMISAVQGTREALSIFGHDDHAFFWQGQFRRARVQMTELRQPIKAAESYQWFIDRFPDSIWLDDAYFWQGCAWLRAERPERAEASFRALRATYDKSKYLRRLDAARADPWGDVCLPKDFAEGLY